LKISEFFRKSLAMLTHVFIKLGLNPINSTIVNKLVYNLTIAGGWLRAAAELSVLTQWPNIYNFFQTPAVISIAL